MANSTKPLLLLDVDGPLNPYAANPTKRPSGYETHRYNMGGWNLRVWLNPEHGPKLLDLGYDLAWATLWEKEANSWISPKIGLPELPFIEFSMAKTTVIGPSTVDISKLYLKTPRIAYIMKKYHFGRPFIWVDDEATSWDEQFLRDVTGAELKIFQIDPSLGLLDSDFDEMRDWAKAHTE